MLSPIKIYSIFFLQCRYALRGLCVTWRRNATELRLAVKLLPYVPPDIFVSMHTAHLIFIQTEIVSGHAA